MLPYQSSNLIKISLASVFLLLTACEMTPVISQEQRRLMQKRTFDTSYKTVFRSFRNVLQDEGYIIRNQDYAGGALVTSKVRPTEKRLTGGQMVAAAGIAFLLGAYGKDSPERRKTSDTFVVSVTFDRISKRRIETRMTIERGTRDNFGSQEGDEVLDSEMYQHFYNKIKAEIKRRTMKKSISS